MKTRKQLGQAAGGKRGEDAFPSLFRARHAGPGARLAFTLIELLVVISIISLLAALLFPVGAAVKRHQYLAVARAEMEQTITALESYRNQYGVYPPSNPATPLLNPLYYELLGVTNVASTGTYRTLDGASSVLITTYTAPSPSGFGVGGAINCATGGTDVETAKARSFLAALRANRIGSYVSGGTAISNLVTSVGGPDQNYLSQLSLPGFGGNPFRYTYPGTNNPNSYDLYVQLSISGKHYLVCNWSQQNIINSPLP